MGPEHTVGHNEPTPVLGTVVHPAAAVAEALAQPSPKPQAPPPPPPRMTRMLPRPRPRDRHSHPHGNDEDAEQRKQALALLTFERRIDAELTAIEERIGRIHARRAAVQDEQRKLISFVQLHAPDDEAVLQRATVQFEQHEQVLEDLHGAERSLKQAHTRASGYRARSETARHEGTWIEMDEQEHLHALTRETVTEVDHYLHPGAPVVASITGGDPMGDISLAQPIPEDSEPYVNSQQPQPAPQPHPQPQPQPQAAPVQNNVCANRGDITPPRSGSPIRVAKPAPPGGGKWKGRPQVTFQPPVTEQQQSPPVSVHSVSSASTLGLEPEARAKPAAKPVAGQFELFGPPGTHIASAIQVPNSPPPLSQPSPQPQPQPQPQPAPQQPAPKPAPVVVKPAASPGPDTPMDPGPPKSYPRPSPSPSRCCRPSPSPHDGTHAS